VLVELLALTSYVRHLDIEQVLVELLALKNYVRYLDIERFVRPSSSNSITYMSR
jgi:hypothetical protein